MATHKQLAANRENAKKSTGPRTPAGKKASAENLPRCGGLGRSVVLRSESAERFRALQHAFYAEYQPEGPTETALVDTMAVCRWRTIRLWNMEVAGFDYELDRSAPEQAELDPPARASVAFRRLGESMSRCETRIDRQFRAAHEQLLRLRETKKCADPNPIRNDF